MSDTTNDAKYIPASPEDLYHNPHPTPWEIEQGKRLNIFVNEFFESYSCFETKIIGAERGGGLGCLVIGLEIRLHTTEGLFESCIRLRSKKYTLSIDPRLEINTYEDVYEDLSELEMWKQLYFQKREIKEDDSKD
jgi:hypothetical protein